MQSNDVLGAVADDLEGLGFSVERVGQTLPRPVFFGDEGKPSRTYEIDAFHPKHGIALEVEAGRATMRGALAKVLTSQINDAALLGEPAA